MTKRILITLLQILLISLILFSSYFFLYLKPKIQNSKNTSAARHILTLHKNNLVQNRLAYVEVTKLDPDSPSFKINASNLVETVKKSQKDGLDLIHTQNPIPENKIIKSEDFLDLLSRTEGIYQKQEEILSKVLNSQSYSEGVNILKSEESVNLLTEETNLILEYGFWQEKLK